MSEHDQNCDGPVDPLLEKGDEPKSVTGDQGAWTNHGLTEQIALDKHIGAKQPARKTFRKIYAGRFVPPSARGT